MKCTYLAGVDCEVGHQLCLSQHVLRGAGVATLVILHHVMQGQLVTVRHLQHQSDSFVVKDVFICVYDMCTCDVSTDVSCNFPVYTPR